MAALGLLRFGHRADARRSRPLPSGVLRGAALLHGFLTSRTMAHYPLHLCCESGLRSYSFTSIPDGPKGRRPTLARAQAVLREARQARSKERSRFPCLA